MKRAFCLLFACLFMICMLPMRADAQEMQQPSSSEDIPRLIASENDLSQHPLLSGIRTLDVGDREYDETEPNDTAADATLIEHDYTLYGSLSATDILDAYVFQLTRDSEITMVSLANQPSLFWVVLDAYGNELGYSLDLGTIEGMYTDGISGTLESGIYYLVAFDEFESNVDYMFYFEIHEHSYTVSGTAPTCTEEGYTTYSCDCGFSKTGNYSPASGHQYDNDADTSCNVCGFVRDSEDEGGDTGAGDLENDLFTQREWDVLKLTNKERLQEGLSPLTGFAKLQEVSDIRAEEITQYFSHTRPDGTSCFTVIDETGLGYNWLGENIAAGYRTPQAVVEGWMGSEGHRANILTADFTHLGVGEIQNSWVQMFMGISGTYTSIAVEPAEVAVVLGTSIDEMNLAAVLNHSVYGTCYLPVDSSYCQGYDPEVEGDQTVTISVLGVSNTFKINVAGHEHIWANATCTTPKTCTICNATEGTATGHFWNDATCTAPKTCAACSATEGTAIGHSWNEASCTAPKTCSICGTTDGTALDHKYVDGICSVCGRDENEPVKVPMYRLYNPYTQEHLLTSDPAERDLLTGAGWSLDGIAWNSPNEGTPVYRLYNPYDDWHTYSMNPEEIDAMVALGWKVDGVVCRSATQVTGKPVYRLFNPYELKNYHLLTASEEERTMLEAIGWRLDGAAWFCLAN